MQTEIPLQKLGGRRRPDEKKFDLVRWGKHVNDYDFSKPHRHNYFEILLFFKGGGIHEIEFTPYPIKSYSLHFIAANAVHLLRRDKNSDGGTVLFTEDFFYQDNTLQTFFKQSNLYTGENGHVLSLPKSKFKEFEIIFNQLSQEHEQKNEGSEMVIKSLLLLFLGKAEQLFRQKSPSTNKLKRNQLVEKYKNLVDGQFLNHLSVKDYSLQIGISPKHLNDLCKQFLSRTAQKIIHERLLLEVKRLLAHTDLSIKEVCFQTGFEDPAHFNHFFRFHLDLTPLAYRKSVRL